MTAARAGARPRVLTLADLDAAAALYVASALRGVQPAALDRQALPTGVVPNMSVRRSMS